MWRTVYKSGHSGRGPSLRSIAALTLHIGTWTACAVLPLIVLCTASWTVLAFLTCLGMILNDVLDALDSPQAKAASLRLRRFLALHSPAYFKEFEVRVWETGEIDARTLYCGGPHGIFSLGWALTMVQSPFDNVRLSITPFLAHNPFYRLWFLLALGRVCSTSSEDLRRRMREGEPLSLIPGGFEEATLHGSAGACDVLYRPRGRRSGFVKLALQHGYTLVPILVIREHTTYSNPRGALGPRMWLNRLHIPTVWPIGYGPFCAWPNPAARLKVCIGPPVKVPTIAEPSRADVERFVDRYEDAVIEAFEANREEGDDLLFF